MRTRLIIKLKVLASIFVEVSLDLIPDSLPKSGECGTFDLIGGPLSKLSKICK